MTKRLVEQHGGTVEALSAGPGTGAEFVLRLPLAAEATVGRAHQAHCADAARPARPLRILVVDDNTDLVDMMVTSLALAGHDALGVFDGRAALAELASCLPDVVILDLGLPGLDGLAVAREIRRMPGLAGVRLVALTGWGQPDDQRKTREAGFDYHLTKPADPQVLHGLLEQIGADLGAVPLARG